MMRRRNGPIRTSIQEQGDSQAAATEHRLLGGDLTRGGCVH